MQGLLNFRSTIAAQGAFYACAGDAKVSVVDVRDIASLAACALTESGHEGKNYEITGPESLAHEEMAYKLSTALGDYEHYRRGGSRCYGPSADHIFAVRRGWFRKIPKPSGISFVIGQSTGSRCDARAVRL